MFMTSIRLPQDVMQRLNHLSELTHRPKSFYIKQALTQYLDDLEDGYIALERITKKDRKLLSSREVLERLGEKDGSKV